MSTRVCTSTQPRTHLLSYCYFLLMSKFQPTWGDDARKHDKASGKHDEASGEPRGPLNESSKRPQPAFGGAGRRPARRPPAAQWCLLVTVPT